MNFLSRLFHVFSRITGKLEKMVFGTKLNRIKGGVLRYRNIDISFPENIFIGEDVSIAPGVSLGASTYGTITIGDRCAIAAGTRFVTPTHDYNVLPISSVGINKSIRVGQDVWIGTAAIILPGVTVNDGAVIAAGAVVTKDVPTDCVVAGVPAQIIKKLESRELRLGYNRKS